MQPKETYICGYDRAIKYICPRTRALREKQILESETKVSDAIIKGFKNNGTGKTRNKMRHLKPKNKKRK